MRQELDLSISDLSTVRGKCYEMAMLPWGATEPHNLHLPYLTDRRVCGFPLSVLFS